MPLSFALLAFSIYVLAVLLVAPRSPPLRVWAGHGALSMRACSNAEPEMPEPQAGPDRHRARRAPHR
jgi:hypothetical protein